MPSPAAPAQPGGPGGPRIRVPGGRAGAGPGGGSPGGMTGAGTRTGRGRPRPTPRTSSPSGAPAGAGRGRQAPAGGPDAADDAAGLDPRLRVGRPYAKASGFLKTQKSTSATPMKRGDVLAEIDAPELEKDVDEAVAAVEQSKARAALAEARVMTAEAERDAGGHGGPGRSRHRPAGRQAFARREAARPDQGSSRPQRHRPGRGRRARARPGIGPGRRTFGPGRGSRPRPSSRRPRPRSCRPRPTSPRPRADPALRGPARADPRHHGLQPDRLPVRRRHHRPSLPSRCLHPLGRRRLLDGAPDGDADRPDAGRGPGARPRRGAARCRRSRHRRDRRAHGPLVHGNRLTAGESENPTTRTMRVEVDLENPDGLLFEGMYGRA